MINLQIQQPEITKLEPIRNERHFKVNSERSKLELNNHILLILAAYYFNLKEVKCSLKKISVCA